MASNFFTNGRWEIVSSSDEREDRNDIGSVLPIRTDPAVCTEVNIITLGYIAGEICSPQSHSGYGAEITFYVSSTDIMV